VSAYGRLAEGGEPEDVMADRIPALQIALALLERDCAAHITGTMLKSTLIGWSALFKVHVLLDRVCCYYKRHYFAQKDYLHFALIIVCRTC
jgi:hypothetical protein